MKSAERVGRRLQRRRTERLIEERIPRFMQRQRFNGPIRVRGSQQGGFTLLELIIVVAAISVLSGIAVPVFLEANVRAKVARSRADMRQVALAMETFYVDQGEYPRPDDHNGESIALDTYEADPFDTRVPTALTTPISYLDTRYRDPFLRESTLENPSFLLYTKTYFNGAFGEGVYQDYLQELLGPASVLQVDYLVLSRGPDRDHEEPADYVWPLTGDNSGDPRGTVLYDPTNGTLSNGDVVYLGAGIGYKER